MRLLWSLLVGLALVFPALAPAQTVKREDVIGTWLGESDRGTKLRTLWRDGLWWGNHGGGRWRLIGDTLWLGDDFRYGYGGLVHRARIPQADTVDTLKMAWFMRYLANDPHYWTGTKKERAELYKKFYQRKLEQIDTTKDQATPPVRFSEKTFRSFLLRPFESHIAAFKVSLTGGRLNLVRLDSLSDSLTPNFNNSLGAREKKGVYERTDSIVPWM